MELNVRQTLACSDKDNELPAGSPKDVKKKSRTCQPQLKGNWSVQPSQLKAAHA